MKRLLAALAASAAAVVLAPGAAGAQDAATITLLHGIPGATVDVAVDGQVVIPSFEPGDTQDLSSFAGETLTNVEVRAAGTTDVVIGPIPSLEIPASGNVTVVAHLDAEGAPTLTPFVNDTTPTADGSGRLVVRHTAAAPAVDIVLGDQRPFTNLSNPNEASAELPAGTIAGAQIAPTGGDPIADVPTVELEAGTDLIVYAVGSLDDGSFTFYTQSIDVGTQSGATAQAPTAVNTGDQAAGSSTWLYAAAAGLLVVGGGAFALRRRIG